LEGRDARVRRATFREKLRAVHYDLYCEIELRGLKAPEGDEDIVDAVAMLRSKVAEVSERLLQLGVLCAGAPQIRGALVDQEGLAALSTTHRLCQRNCEGS
jgi:hypothetical protein